MIKSKISPHRLSWKFALYELMLIFIGINLAIWFNNWNLDRNFRQLEKETLIQLINGLETDIRAIDGNINNYTRRLNSYDRLITHFENNKPYSDSLPYYVSSITGYTFFINNMAPFEVLKSHGFDLISSDSLRLKILDYYEVQQQIILESDAVHQEHAMQYLKPIIIAHFSLAESDQFKPFDYYKLTGNREVLQTFRWASFNDRAILQRYHQTKTVATELKQRIETHIKRL